MLSREKPALSTTAGRDAAHIDVGATGGVAHLEARGVAIEYAKPGSKEVTTAVEQCDLTLERGDFVCLVGPSGCGKTTLLNAVAGFVELAEGALELDGRPIPGPGPDRAMVFQHANLLPWRTVQANVSYGLELGKKVKKQAAKERADELLELVGLAGAGQQYPAQLSGGMQARVNLARALAVEPEILLLDEPFAAIDAQTREVLQVELLRVCAARDVTALFVTHDITEAAFLADRVCVFSPRPGRIVKEITVPWARPRSHEIRRTPEFAQLRDEIADVLYGAKAGAGAEGAR
ncbi:ABC transporter ATP-binding protein [Amycolatopsis rhabdoformis]|uniref:ABC transporter ATP-binding protein n=1 Tax=Amycolatopsis rhabdoformis TaxID=1448059 RepID=A0ABZ1IJD5_9PSEU|nr:ABC transporter ATP-binding protein [Amycolatopsis rhabdoformis]WSE33664.1 ABC transporter ATP-binding protein [Amycolatopsis rhabdoformis]